MSGLAKRPTSGNAALAIDLMVKDKGEQTALWLPPRLNFHSQHASTTSPWVGATSYADLDRMARSAAHLLLARGAKPGDKVLIAVELGVDLYAFVLAAARLGLPLLLVEPWLNLKLIETIVEAEQPKFFVASMLGKLWGLRIGAVRRIPHQLATREIRHTSPDWHTTEVVDADLPCLIAFTSGTSGQPKGVVRTHAYLMAQLRALNDSLGLDKVEGADLVTFANFTLANLANGRTSLIMPSRWSDRDFQSLENLPKALAPRSLTAGPAFMRRLLGSTSILGFQTIHIGGALTPNSLFRSLFQRFPTTHFTHVYGSSEVEPVATMDARAAVNLSEAQGYYHTLCVGSPYRELQTRHDQDSLWVSGPSVSPEYLHATAANAENKRRDANGILWHRMGDRIKVISSPKASHALNGEPVQEWYYAGRSHQDLDLFTDEQKLYNLLGDDRAFFVNGQNPPHLEGGSASELRLYLDRSLLHRPAWALFGGTSGARTLPATLYKLFPRLSSIYVTDIVFDQRHRARLDRASSLAGAKPI